MSGRASLLRAGGPAAQVAASQFAVAGANYLLLALAARHLDAAGFAVLSSYYLLINTVGRGLFAAVELETTRAVAQAVAAGEDDAPARRSALVHTGWLLAGALALLVAATPLLSGPLGTTGWALGSLAVGAVAMAASYLLRGPLAGHRRYTRYAATFWVEAGVGLVAAVALASAGVTEAPAWILVLALAPLAAPLLAPLIDRRALRVGGPAAVSPMRAVIWSAALLLAGQGVWNIAPVLVTARLTDDAAAAAGFVTVAVLLRAPVLLFPSAQAMLLPRFTALIESGDDAASGRLMRRLMAAVAVAGVLWVVAAVFVVPPVSHLVFGATQTPPTWVLAALAASTVLGGAAQIRQTWLVALRRPASAAAGWVAGLVVLVGVGMLAAPPLTAGTLGQLLGAATVLVVLSSVRRSREQP